MSTPPCSNSNPRQGRRAGRSVGRSVGRSDDASGDLSRAGESIIALRELRLGRLRDAAFILTELNKPLNDQVHFSNPLVSRFKRTISR
jgi:hypothetical protein